MWKMSPLNVQSWKKNWVMFSSGTFMKNKCSCCSTSSQKIMWAAAALFCFPSYSNSAAFGKKQSPGEIYLSASLCLFTSLRLWKRYICNDNSHDVGIYALSLVTVRSVSALKLLNWSISQTSDWDTRYLYLDWSMGSRTESICLY